MSIILGTTEPVAGIREKRDKVQVTTAEQTKQTNKLIKNRVRDVIPVNSLDCGSRRADRARRVGRVLNNISGLECFGLN